MDQLGQEGFAFLHVCVFSDEQAVRASNVNLALINSIHEAKACAESGIRKR